LLAAKMMGRWRSGAPLALCPFHDDPRSGQTRSATTTFLFEEDDKAGIQDTGWLAHPSHESTRCKDRRAWRESIE
jgi:hypothetical protein